MKFIANTWGEFLKTKKTVAFWLTIAGAAFIPAVNVLRLLARPDVFVSRMQQDPWAVHLEDNWGISAAFLLPVFVIMITTVIVQIETSNNTWKQVFASPRSYADIFFTKFIVILSMLLFASILFTLFIILTAYGTAVVNPAYPFLTKPAPWARMFELNIKLYLAVLGITALQYGLSLRMRNPMAPIGVGIGLLIVGFMIRQWEHVAYYPFMHPLLVYFQGPSNPGLESQALINSAVTCLAALAIFFFDFYRRRERG